MISDNSSGRCVVCGALASYGRVCGDDRDAIARQLHGIVGQMARLEAALVPASRPADGQPGGGKPGGAPLPARLDALSLLGPGNPHVSAGRHPKIRYWSTVEDVDVATVQTSTTIRAGRQVDAAAVVTQRRQVTRWHREHVVDDDGRPVWVADDDQVGGLPPREWLTSWVRLWQETLQRAGPPRARRRKSTGSGHGKDFRAVALARLAADPAAASWYAAMHAVRRAYDRAVQATLAGHTRGYSGDITRWDRTGDPLTDELDARYGTPDTASITRPVTFLLLWLDEAVEHPDIPIADFATELRAVTAELAWVLGEQPAQQWLGRCPARITVPTGGEDGGNGGGDGVSPGVSRPCGAGLWQDPHASQVQCPRCHSTWGPRRADLLRLAVDIRTTWPVERRRRYTAEEIEHIRAPRCPACGAACHVAWRDVTGSGDRWRTWQPTTTTCPNTCPEAVEVLA